MKHPKCGALVVALMLVTNVFAQTAADGGNGSGEEFLDSIMSRITFPGSLFLGCVAILPAFAGVCGINHSFAQFFGGTSLLILVGVVLDTLQQIESHLKMHHYDGLMKSGKIAGRSGI